ncbi:MAG: hypothetical protein ACRDHE_05700 [Ktedonobacterales bacterium]
MVAFGVSQYTLVFRQRVDEDHDETGMTWAVVRPAAFARNTPTTYPPARIKGASAVAQMFAAPICSVLSLEGGAYEHFLLTSGILDDALTVLVGLDPTDPSSVETTRRQIQSLVMAAEVRHIVDSMPA